MTQDFRVLRCCECKIFQVHQVKKSNKWNCKVCGTKQSVKQVYGKGSGADCRRHVQKLNTLRGVQAFDQDVTLSQPLPENSGSVWKSTMNEPVLSNCDSNNSKMSRWSKFLQDENEQSESTSNDFDENCQSVSHIVPSEGKEPLPKFRRVLDVQCIGTSCPKPLALQQEKKQFISPVIQGPSVKHVESSLTSGGQVNKMSYNTTLSGFKSVSEKLKLSHFVKSKDLGESKDKTNTTQKPLNSVTSNKSKWSHFVQMSNSSESEEDGSCRKTSDTLDIQNVKYIKPDEKSNKGFQFILKASLKSK